MLKFNVLNKNDWVSKICLEMCEVFNVVVLIVVLMKILLIYKYR
jgi:hypothetical protein